MQLTINNSESCDFKSCGFVGIAMVGGGCPECGLPLPQASKAKKENLEENESDLKNESLATEAQSLIVKLSGFGKDEIAKMDSQDVEALARISMKVYGGGAEIAEPCSVEAPITGNG